MKINGQTFCAMCISAANALDNNKVSINNLNVFPVPDGDTGINMSLTLSTVRGLAGFEGTISECAEKVANVILRSARGNSGAIISLFFRGMAKSMRGLIEADSAEIAAAFDFGTKEAYKAVMNPVEGTILTVMRNCSEHAVKVTMNKNKYKGDVIGLFTVLVQESKRSLAQTPDFLPILKQANVVDAGGSGFVVILKGMLAALNNRPVKSHSSDDDSENKNENSKADFSKFDTEDITFGYCTECIVDKSESNKGEGKVDDLHKFLTGIGDSLVFIDDEEIIKLHVHTNHPGLVLENALKYGVLATVKIENMRMQHTEMAQGADSEKPKTTTPPTKKYGFVTVCAGSGICDTFRDLGADNIVIGGQTMNPSTENVLDAINMTGSENVFVLPNSKNIYLVAKQAAEMTADKNVIVIPTKNVPQGISAMLSFSEEADIDENIQNMTSAIESVKTISTTHSVKDTELFGVSIKEGQILGLLDGKIKSVADSDIDCIKKMADAFSGASYITVFYGEDISDENAETVKNEISLAAQNAEVVLINGKQPVYEYLISIE